MSEQFDTTTYEYTRENAKFMISRINGLVTLQNRSRSDNSRSRYAEEIRTILKWLDDGKFEYITEFNVYRLKRTPEEKAKLAAEMRASFTHLYEKQIAEHKGRIKSYIDSLEHELKQAKERIADGYDRLGTNALTVTAHSIEDEWKALQIKSEMISRLGHTDEVADTLD